MERNSKMNIILKRLTNHEIISKEDAKNILITISKGRCTTSQIAAFLTIYMMRSITTEELEGFRDALLERCIPVDLTPYNAIDLCGTGGDGKNTFNISTLAAFVTAGAGVRVAKHGNYGVSSVCGSSNVMEYLGIVFTKNEDFLRRSIEHAGICILHAPLFHPAMQHVATVRHELGIKTFFNMLGPMVNPSFPKNQLVGVFNLELARIYSYLYQNTDIRYTILHALDGYDELSLTGAAKVIRNDTEQLITAADFGVLQHLPSAIRGGKTIPEAARLFMTILNGKGTPPQHHVVCANAGLAIATVKGISPAEGFEMADESLRSGKGLNVLKRLQQLSKNIA